jgi:hypothetical protein
MYVNFEPELIVIPEAYADRSTGIVGIKSEPAFNWLHADPRFQYLLRRIGLASY